MSLIRSTATKNMEGQVEIDLKPLQDKKVNANEFANTVGKLEERHTECTARKPIEVAVLCIVIILLWGLLSLPGVFSNVDLSKVRANTAYSNRSRFNISREKILISIVCVLDVPCVTISI